ncbi:MAG: hypothetical protein J2P16_00205 [Mycobacterium sp.]|nr:hypothetical protein [Mycobacterium sp.]
MIPEAVRAAVRQRAKGRCEDCGETRRLELHHLRYWTEPDWHGDSERIDGRETPHDLDALCRDCHHSQHIDLNGEFWSDPQEMEQHWFGYFSEMAKP